MTTIVRSGSDTRVRLVAAERRSSAGEAPSEDWIFLHFESQLSWEYPGGLLSSSSSRALPR